MFDMFGNVIKNLFSEPVTRRYPYEKRECFKNTRGQMGGIEIEKCIFCGICAKKCPSNAINVNREEKSWEIDKFKCIICGACVEACPKKCLYMEEEHQTASYTKEKFKCTQISNTKPVTPDDKEKEKVS